MSTFLRPRTVHALGLLVLWVAACAAVAAPPDSVRIGIGEYPPFKQESEPGGGALTEIVTEAFKASGVRSAIEWVPNNRAIAGVMSGRYDGSFGWARSAEREESLLFSSKPIHTYRMVFVQRTGEARDWDTLSDLGRWRVGVTRGNFYSQPFADLQTRGVIVVDEAVDDVGNLKKLLLKRIDLFPLEESVARYLIATKLEADEGLQLAIQSKAFWMVPIHFVVSKKVANAQAIMDAFDAGYRELQRSKRLDVLERKLRR